MLVEHYDVKHVPNPSPTGTTPYQRFEEVRQTLVEVCRRYGVTGPDDDPCDCDCYIVDDQYNDELYHRSEIYRRDILTVEWIEDIASTLRRSAGWRLCVKNLRFSYLIVCTDRVMVTGHAFSGCESVEQVASVARDSLSGIKGEKDRFTSERFHRDRLFESPNCGCYKCRSLFEATDIVQWDDDNLTAICPKCGATRVLGSSDSTLPISPSEIEAIGEMAFGKIIDH